MTQNTETRNICMYTNINPNIKTHINTYIYELKYTDIHTYTRVYVYLFLF